MDFGSWTWSKYLDLNLKKNQNSSTEKMDLDPQPNTIICI